MQVRIDIGDSGNRARGSFDSVCVRHTGNVTVESDNATIDHHMDPRYVECFLDGTEERPDAIGQSGAVHGQQPSGSLHRFRHSLPGCSVSPESKVTKGGWLCL